MKLFVKLMVAALILALLLPFTLLKDDQGKTLMSFSDFKLPEFDLPGLPDMSSAGDLLPSSTGSGRIDKFYKWYDAKGDVQFTTAPPPDGIEFIVKEFDPDANVIQAVKKTADERASETSGANSQTHDPAAGQSSTGLSSPYSKESIEKLFEDTRNIENLLNQRANDQNATINQ